MPVSFCLPYYYYKGKGPFPLPFPFTDVGDTLQFSLRLAHRMAPGTLGSFSTYLQVVKTAHNWPRKDRLSRWYSLPSLGAMELVASLAR